MELTLSPKVKDQELITKESTRVTYWEGSVKVEGKYQGDQSREWLCGINRICEAVFQRDMKHLLMRLAYSR